MTNYVMGVDPLKLQSRVGEQMEENGIATQKELAVKANVAQSTVSYMMTASKTNYTYKTVDALAQYFNVSTDWLAGKLNARKPRKCNGGEELPNNNLFRQLADAETPERPRPIQKFTAQDLKTVLESIDNSLKVIKAKLEA